MQCKKCKAEVSVTYGLNTNLCQACFSGSSQPTDNWKHRSKGMLCGSCMFFVEKVTTVTQKETHIIGRCRRNAPTMNGFPAVFSDDWCGNHKLDEMKI